MTPRQSELLSFLRQRAAESDVPPSYEEMRSALGLASKSGAARLIEALELQGKVRRVPGAARSIVVADPLDGMTTEALVAELARRGVFVREREAA